jgi:hypothetical protein
MKCIVAFISRRTVELEVEGRDTVEEVLRKLADYEGLHRESVSLFFDKNSQQTESIRHVIYPEKNLIELIDLSRSLLSYQVPMDPKTGEIRLFAIVNVTYLDKEREINLWPL